MIVGSAAVLWDEKGYGKWDLNGRQNDDAIEKF